MARTRVRFRPRARSRRRRTAAVLGIVVAAALVMGPVALASGQGSAGLPAPSLERYVVLPGDTLWSLALRAAPGRDPRPLIQAIEKANDLEAGDLVPGRTLLIPTTP